MSVPDPPSRPQCYEFGPFVADLRRRQLWQDHTVVPLNSKTLDVLFALIENRHKVLEKDDLLRLVWPDAVVQEGNLARQISMLRHALGESRAQHDYIVTVPGRGYQFVADVRELARCPERIASPVEAPRPQPAGAAVTDRDADHERDQQPISLAPPGPPAPVQLESGRSWRARDLIAISAASLVAVVGLVMLAGIVSRPASPVRQLHQLTFEGGLPREPAWSPDGQRLAYTSDLAGSADIWVQSLSDPDPVRLTTSTAKDWQPDWSPDGHWIAFRSEREGGGIYIVKATGGEPRRIADTGFRPRWSPDGKHILLLHQSVRTGARGLFLATPEGAMPRKVLTDLVGEFTGVSPGASIDAAWHPDGRVSIWGRHPETGWTFITAPIDGAPGAGARSVIVDEVATKMQDAGLTLESFVWARSGRAIYFEGVSQETRNAWRIDVAPETLSWVRGPERLTTNTSQDGDIAISPDGTKLAFAVRSSQTRMWSMSLDAAGQALTASSAPVTSGAGNEVDADAPLDGSQIAYRAVRGGRQELRMHSLADGQDRLLLASDTLRRSSPRWSADGTRIVYAVSRPGTGAGKGQFAVGVMPASGGDERLHETQPETSFTPTDWSRDGDVILGWCRERSTKTIGTCLFSVAGGTTRANRLEVIASDPEYNLFCQRFSPDHRWISFVAVRPNDPTAIRIYVQPTDGGVWQRITDGSSYVDKARWSPDGRAIYYISDRDGFLNVWGQRFDTTLGRPTGTPFRVTAFTGEQRAIPAQFGPMEFALASKRLFLPLKDSSSEIWILDHVDR